MAGTRDGHPWLPCGCSECGRLVGVGGTPAASCTPGCPLWLLEYFKCGRSWAPAIKRRGPARSGHEYASGPPPACGHQAIQLCINQCCNKQSKLTISSCPSVLASPRFPPHLCIALFLTLVLPVQGDGEQAGESLEAQESRLVRCSGYYCVQSFVVDGAGASCSGPGGARRLIVKHAAACLHPPLLLCGGATMQRPIDRNHSTHIFGTWGMVKAF